MITTVDIVTIALAGAAFITSVASTYYSRRQFALMQIEHRFLIDSYTRKPDLFFFLQDAAMMTEPADRVELETQGFPYTCSIYVFIHNAGRKGARDARVNLVWPADAGLVTVSQDHLEQRTIEGPFDTPEELLPHKQSNWYRWEQSFPSGSYVGRLFDMEFDRFGEFPLRVRIECDDLEGETVIRDARLVLRDSATDT
jgi:hypothetical protein